MWKTCWQAMSLNAKYVGRLASWADITDSSLPSPTFLESGFWGSQQLFHSGLGEIQVQLPDCPGERRIAGDALLDLSAGVQDRAVIATAKIRADLVQGQ